jgi:hypothetical protein
MVVVVEVVVEVESEPGLVRLPVGRGSEWDRDWDLGRVRLGNDMVRIRVRYESTNERDMETVGDEISHLNLLERLSRVHILYKLKGEKAAVCLFGQIGKRPFGCLGSLSI